MFEGVRKMNALSNALEDIKKHYGIEEIENIVVDYGVTTSVMFKSDNYTYIITVTPIPKQKEQIEPGEEGENGTL